MTTGVLDKFARARSVADAVLYEGYVLYPYRASSRKNQIRWQFGVLTPRSYSDADPFERSSMHTECIVDPGSSPLLAVRIRFLQVQDRGIEEATNGSRAVSGEDATFSPVQTLAVGNETYVEWEEAVDRMVDVEGIDLKDLDGSVAGQVEREVSFCFAAGSETELISSATGGVAGRVVRRRHALNGRLLVEAGPTEDERFVRVKVTVENTTEIQIPSPRREEVTGHSLVAVHTMLAVTDGEFVSLLDPPAKAVESVTHCWNDGTFPVLVSRDLVLSSPIILYDYPQVAPESPGDLYDATEIDEILALRVLTLTDEEKSEARGTDPKSAAIIERCDGMSPDTWERLHGTMRSVTSVATTQQVPAPEEPDAAPWWDPVADASVDPWSDVVFVKGVEIAKGASVRLRPSHRSDAQDIFLEGRSATVAGVFEDVDGNTQVAVTVDDDPATEELMWQGRYLFFHPDEIEPSEGSGALG